MYFVFSFSIIGEVIKYYLFNSLVTNDRTDKKNLQNKINSFHANRKVLVDLLDIATAQEPGMLKAITTGTFFMIGQVVLSIDDRHISPCNMLTVHPVFTTIA